MQRAGGGGMGWVGGEGGGASRQDELSAISLSRKHWYPAVKDLGGEWGDIILWQTSIQSAANVPIKSRFYLISVTIEVNNSARCCLPPALDTQLEDFFLLWNGFNTRPQYMFTFTFWVYLRHKIHL